MPTKKKVIVLLPTRAPFGASEQSCHAAAPNNHEYDDNDDGGENDGDAYYDSGDNANGNNDDHTDAEAVQETDRS